MFVSPRYVAVIEEVPGTGQNPPVPGRTNFKFSGLEDVEVDADPEETVTLFQFNKVNA